MLLWQLSLKHKVHDCCIKKNKGLTQTRPWTWFQSYARLFEIAQLWTRYQDAILMHSLNIYICFLLHSVVLTAILGVKLASQTSVILASNCLDFFSHLCLYPFAHKKSLQMSFFSLSITLLSAMYFSLTKDLYLGKTCLPLSCACQ